MRSVFRGGLAVILAAGLCMPSFSAEVFLETSRKGGGGDQMFLTGTHEVDVTPQEIQERRPATVNEAVSKIPGLFTTQRAPLGFGLAAGSGGKISLRGFSGAQQTLFLLDGTPQMMGVFGHPVYDAWDIEAIERVEVVKGPDSVRYGSGAMGGSFNIIPKRRREKGMETLLSQSGGSFGTRSSVFTNGAKWDRADHYFTFSNRHSDGHRENSAATSYNYALTGGYQPRPGWDLQFQTHHNNTYAQDPGTLTEVNQMRALGRKLDKWSKVKRTEVAMTNRLKLDKSEGVVKGYFDYGDHVIRANSSAGNNYYWDSIDRVYGGSLVQRFMPRADGTLELGYDIKSAGGEGHDSTPGQARLDYANRMQVEQGLFLTAKQKLGEALLLSGGIRGHHHEQYGWIQLPQGGGEYQLTSATKLRANAAKGFRSPTITELYNVAASSVDLEPEKAWTYEAGLTQALGEKISLEGSAFYTAGDNLIRTVGTGVNAKYRNTGYFRHRGVEGIARVALLPALEMMGSVAIQDPERETQATPKRRYQLGFNGKRKAVSGEFLIERVERLYGADANGSRLPDFWDLSVKARWEATQHVALTMDLKNLSDQDYQTMTGYPVPGRSAFGGVEVTF